MSTYVLARAEWRRYCDRLSRELAGRRVELDVASLDLGDHVEARWLPFLGIVFDGRADVLEGRELAGQAVQLVHLAHALEQQVARGGLDLVGDLARAVAELEAPAVPGEQAEERLLPLHDAHGGLPRTSTPVPASLADVSGRKYQSAPSEWSQDPTLGCSGFSMSGAQYFQYQWVLETPTSGSVQASADLDGDGAIESRFSLRVDCVENRCATVDSQALR